MSFKTLLSVFLIFCFAISSCNSDSKTTDENSYQKTRDLLLQKEEQNPENFLTISGQDKKNLLRQTVIKGKISNNATIAVFRDIEIKLSFYSKTRTLLETDTETIFEQVQPGQTKSFKTKYFAPKGTDSVHLEVIGAKMGSY